MMNSQHQLGHTPLYCSNNFPVIFSKYISQLTVHIEPGAVDGAARPVGGLAGVEAAVLHNGAADVNVGDDLSMQRDILTHHEPEVTTLHNSHYVCGVLVWIVAIRYAGRHFALLVSRGVLNYQVYKLYSPNPVTDTSICNSNSSVCLEY